VRGREGEGMGGEREQGRVGEMRRGEGREREEGKEWASLFESSLCPCLPGLVKICWIVLEISCQKGFLPQRDF